jgi:hypothetical protein
MPRFTVMGLSSGLAEAPVDAGASAFGEGEAVTMSGRRSLLALTDVDHSANVWSKTVTPPWTTVILTLVNAMSVIVAVQLPFGQPAS